MPSLRPNKAYHNIIIDTANVPVMSVVWRKTLWGNVCEWTTYVHELILLHAKFFIERHLQGWLIFAAIYFVAVSRKLAYNIYLNFTILLTLLTAKEFTCLPHIGLQPASNALLSI